MGASALSRALNLFIDGRRHILIPSSRSSMPTMPLYPMHRLVRVVTLDCKKLT